MRENLRAEGEMDCGIKRDKGKPGGEEGKKRRANINKENQKVGMKPHSSD